MSIFKKEYLEKKKKEEMDKHKKWFVYLVFFYKRINMIMLLLAMIINASVIVYTIYNFNIGIMLFIINQYFIMLYFFRVRKEREKRN